jgi:hypothetical protein
MSRILAYTSYIKIDTCQVQITTKITDFHHLICPYQAQLSCQRMSSDANSHSKARAFAAHTIIHLPIREQNLLAEIETMMPSLSIDHKVCDQRR